MKVLIVGFHPHGHVPYVANYENAMKKDGIDFDAVYWDRFENRELEKCDNEYTIHIKCSLGGNRLKKIIPMLKYRNIVKDLINKYTYDKIIVLSTLPAVLLNDILLDKYRDNYILDIRDYTYEKYSFYKNIVMKLISNSYFTGISSKGFLRFLDFHKKIVYTHNITNENAEVTNCTAIDFTKKINIGFVGGVRYFNENSALFSKLDHDKFILSYIGYRHADCNLEDYCKYKKIANVIFKGKFNNIDKPMIYKDIDIINSLYGDFSLEVTTAIPNRLYDALLYKKPILVSKGTYLSEVVEEKGIGLAIDVFNDDVNKLLIKYIESIDYEMFLIKCRSYIEEIKREQSHYLNKIDEFLYNK